ncbi:MULTISPECIES: MATE family efflux transporter [unclassified Rhizobium]|uniref:MATE family efflux transporter n=1 Tax=unclassified Rhizobium TaxID=2613769 RepID=UPI000EA96A7D|nr:MULTISPECIES: MATE family efflux transporter [unclassified Rhizobium]AYG70030.1 MATE family efflux transporter [Rhizobium sp. CCGE531]AYG76406.1 MATE family efflux transporter [Rhizobium sp. CCGE532]
MNSRFHPYLEIIKLAAPIAGIQFAQVALTSADLLMMGLISVEAVAAGGLAVLLYNQLRTMCVGMVTGVGNMIASAIARGERRTSDGKGDEIAHDEVRELVSASMLLATIVATGAGIVLVALSHLLGFLGQDSKIVSLAQPIMLTLAPGLVPMLWLNVLRQFAVGMRRAGSLLRVTIISIGVNVLLNAIFIYGWLGMPRLGLAGIGLSTTLVQVWTFLVYFRTVRRDPEMSSLLSLGHWRASPAIVMRIARMGAPIALTYGSEAAITSIASIFMGTFGPIALAASNVVNQLAYIVYQLNIGLSHGSSVLVSRAVGKDEHAEIGSIARRTLAISFSIMTVVGFLYALLPGMVLRPFLGAQADPAILAMAATLLWFAIAHQFLKGSQNICIGLLRGLGNTKAGLLNTFIGYWLIGIPAMAICGYWLGWASNGIWFGLCLGFGATTVLLWWRFTEELQTTIEPPSRDANISSL